LLVIVPAAQAPEIASSRALRIAKEYDGEGKWLLKLIVRRSMIVLMAVHEISDSLIFVHILSSIVYLHHLFLLGVLLLNLSVRKFFSYVALLHIKKIA